MENNKTETPIFNEEENNLREQLDLYLKHWKWFALSVFIVIVGAFLYLRYSTSVYQTQATILVKEEDRGGGLSEATILEDLGSVPSFSTVNVENEIEVLKSKSLMAQVVEDLNLTTQYFAVGKIKTVELYKNPPIQLKFIGQDSLSELTEPYTFDFKPVSDESFRFKFVEDADFKEAKYGKVLDLGFGKFFITPNKTSSEVKENWQSDDYLIRISPKYNVVRNYQSSLMVEAASQRSSVLNLSMQNSVSEKSEDILNNLIHQFNEDAISDKNLISENTSKFISERLSIISEELDSVETSKNKFKTTNRLTDIPEEAKLYLQEDREIAKQRVEVETQIELANTVISYLKDSSRTSDLLPVNLGISQEGISTTIGEYNQLVLERDRQLQFSTELNPIVVTLNNQIEDLKNTILQSLQNAKRSLQISQNEIRKQEAKIDSRISAVPDQEQIFRDIDRQQQIKETLYLYLLQKREETAISLAITAPVAKIVDSAYTSRDPVSPKSKIVLLAALIIGLLIPFLIIYVHNLLDTKIHNKSDVEKISKEIPILGEIPKIDSKDDDTIKVNDRSILAESFRILRTNLGYFTKSKSDNSKKIIFVTSTVKGEGKTFVAFNLALTLSSTEKRVLLVGADIRNPQLHRYIDDPSSQKKGLSEYLYDDKVSADSIIDSYKINRKQIDMVLSGRIPPNPAELLMSSKMKMLLDQAKVDYDYVIVDTAPTMLVTDTLLISQYSDFTVYVTRAEYTEKKLLQFPIELSKEDKLNNVAFVVNNVNISNYGYGNKYGYGYGVDKEPVFKRLKKWLNIKS